MASHDDDTMPEETQGYKLSQPKQSLAEYQQMGTCILLQASRYAQYIPPSHGIPCQHNMGWSDKLLFAQSCTLELRLQSS